MFLTVACIIYFPLSIIHARASIELGYAARNGDMYQMREIFKAQNPKNLNIESALTLSASYSRISAMRYLICMGARDTNTALVAASVRNKIKAVQFLISEERCKVPATDLVSAMRAAGSSGAAEAEWLLFYTLKRGDVPPTPNILD
tara:strand:- start:2528 stop:2965 length:438 start_codon:yes stop_codon:yes gene_type:complete